MPTMVDVARRAGVSLSTVSYALNGTRPISQETRQRILVAMEELGYKPHALARGLASKRSRIVALLFPAAERGLGMTELEFIVSAADAATTHGYNLLLWSSALRDPHELQQHIRQGLVDGVVLMEVHLDDARVGWLREQGFPFSIIGRCANNDGISYADIDFAQATRDVVNYLATLGHTQIAFLNQSRSVFDAGYGPAVLAHTGFERAMADAGLSGISRFCEATSQAGYEAWNALLGECPDLTAVVAMNDRIIPGVLQAISDHGWRVPDDISFIPIVTSARIAEVTMPPLTALEPPGAELGRLGVELLIQQLDAHTSDLPQMLLPCRLVTRNSAGPAPRREPHM